MVEADEGQTSVKSRRVARAERRHAGGDGAGGEDILSK